MSLTERAYAKLNLALHVRGRRTDGYHDIETVFAFCEDGDELSVTPSGELSLEVTGPFGADVPQGADNLVLKAAKALQDGPAAELHLVKKLPAASGIGGGSADAAAAMRLLTRFWDLDPQDTARVAPTLGADVPACLLSRSCRGTGTGDRLEPIELGLAGNPALLVNPLVPLSTRTVFDAWDGVDRGPLEDWRDSRNDLESAAISLVPEIADLLGWLRGQPGAGFVRMSGSGATCFALFDSQVERDQAAAAVPAQWWHLATALR